MAPELRLATLADIPSLTSLIHASVRTLQRDDYAPEVLDAALQHAYGVDTQLVLDGTYFALEVDGHIAACGGWSRRATLCGGDSAQIRDNSLLDPAREAAKIRAFYVHPDYARRGLGKMLLDASEQAAIDAGFRRFEIGATRTGVAFYERYGYSEISRYGLPLFDGLELEIVYMTKALSER